MLQYPMLQQVASIRSGRLGYKEITCPSQKALGVDVVQEAAPEYCCLRNLSLVLRSLYALKGLKAFPAHLVAVE